MKKQKDIQKVSLMKGAHILAKSLSEFNDNSYKENFTLALKASHLNKTGVGQNSVDELNWIKNNLPGQLVSMSNIQDSGKESKYTIKIYPYEKVEIKQHFTVNQSYMN